jgi:hypothetical protein
VELVVVGKGAMYVCSVSVEDLEKVEAVRATPGVVAHDHNARARILVEANALELGLARDVPVGPFVSAGKHNHSALVCLLDVLKALCELGIVEECVHGKHYVDAAAKDTVIGDLC